MHLCHALLVARGGLTQQHEPSFTRAGPSCTRNSLAAHAHWRPEGRLLSLVGIVNRLTRVEWQRVGRRGFEVEALVEGPSDVVAGVHEQSPDADDLGCLDGGRMASRSRFLPSPDPCSRRPTASRDSRITGTRSDRLRRTFPATSRCRTLANARRTLPDGTTASPIATRTPVSSNLNDGSTYETPRDSGRANR